MQARRALLAVVVMSLAAMMAACASRGGKEHAQSSGEESTIASLHQRKCASCHRLVEPATRTRVQIVQAMGRHEKRLHLSQEEWKALADYLAPDTTSAQAKSTTDSTATR